MRERNPRLAYLDLLAIGYSLYGVGAAGPFIRTHLGLTDAETGLHSTAMAVGLVAAGLLAARLDRRLTARSVHAGAVVSIALGWLLLAWALAFPVTLVAAAFIGAGSGIILGHVNTHLGAEGGATSRQLLARANVWAMVAALAGPLVIAASVALGLSWQGALGPAALVLAAALAGSRSVRSPLAEATAGAARLPWAYWRAWLFVVFAVAIEFSIVFWAATLVQRRTGLTTADATLVAAGFLAGMTAGRLLLSERHVAAVNPHRMVFAAVATALIGALIVWMSEAAPLSALGLFVAGVGVASLYPVGVALALETAPGQPATAGARLTIASGGAILTAPFVLGVVSDAVGVIAGWSMILVVGAGALAMALIVEADARRRRGESPVAGELERAAF